MSELTKEFSTSIRKDFNFILKKKDARVFILGADGSGKTVLMHYLAEKYHENSVPVKFLAPTKLMTGKRITPDWMEMQHWKYPKFDRNKMHLLDDAQLQAHSREHWKKKNINYAKIMSVARHRHAGIIITTQQGADIDRKLLAKGHAIFFKKPSYLGAETERPFLQKLSRLVRDSYEKDIEAKGLDYQEYTYVISDYYRGWVGPTGLPSYWTTELGDW